MAKKIVLLLLCTVLAIGCLCGCGHKKDDGKIRIVATTFPAYDWTREVLGDNTDNIELTLLLDKGVDMHSYQPSAEDIIKISDCDLFVYIGGESEQWVDKALEQAKNKDMVVVNLMDVLKDHVYEEETVEGMQKTDDHDHDHDDHDHDDHDHDDHEGHENENDEHIWLSLHNASVACDAVADAMGKLDKEHADTYRTNAENYQKQLDELNKQYRQVVDSAAIKTIVVADRFPFRYLTADYDIRYYAAFAGCSAESEASFDTIIFLAKKVDELGLKVILTTENTTGSVAETVKENTAGKNQKILALDSMQSVSMENVKNGTTYLSVMKKNLEVLREALS